MATRTSKATPGTTGRFASELRRQLGLYARLMRLDRPIGTWLLLWPTLWALWIAGEGRPDPQIFIVFVLGVIVMRSAGCVINDYADRKFDPHVERTRNRPLATGEVAPAEALVLFLALGLLAIALLLTLNTLTRWLAVGGALLTIAYPFMKRYFVAPQLVLGAAFGWGVPMAFAAQTGEIPRLAWLMWLTVLVWAVIYDTLYAMADRAGDELIGVKSTAILFGSADLFCIGLLQVTMLGALALIGQAAGLGAWYFGAVGIAGALFLHQRISVNDRDPQHCFEAFLANRHVGATIFAGILLDYVYR